MPDLASLPVDFGESRPVDPNSTANGHTHNRRIELQFVPIVEKRIPAKP